MQDRFYHVLTEQNTKPLIDKYSMLASLCPSILQLGLQLITASVPPKRCNQARHLTHHGTHYVIQCQKTSLELTSREMTHGTSGGVGFPKGFLDPTREPSVAITETLTLLMRLELQGKPGQDKEAAEEGKLLCKGRPSVLAVYAVIFEHLLLIDRCRGPFKLVDH